MGLIDKTIVIRFIRLFILSTLIVALAWGLLENEILGGIRDISKDVLYAMLIGVCIATAQVVLDPRPRNMSAARSSGQEMAASGMPSVKKSAKKKGRR